MIEMQELEQAWQGIDERLEQHGALLHELRRRDAVDVARAHLHRLSLRQLAQLAIGILIVLWAGGYWVDHWGQPHLVVYGVAIHAYGLALVVAAAVQLARVARVDYRAPVLDVQRQLLALRRLRVRSERGLLILGFVMWVPFLFVAVRRFLHLDVWLARPEVVWWNLAAGVGLAAGVAWFTHRFRDAFERDAAGRSLREAEAELAELAGSIRED